MDILKENAELENGELTLNKTAGEAAEPITGSLVLDGILDDVNKNKIKLNTLGLKRPIEQDLKINDVIIKVKSRIPYEEVFDMITWCVNHILDDRSFISGPIQEVMTDFAILNYYTNLNCAFLLSYSDIRMIYENYDIVRANNLIPQILVLIDKEQIDFFKTTLEKTLTSIIAYRNSAKGIVDVLTEDAKDQSDILEKVYKSINDPQQMEGISKLLDFYKENS